MCEPPSKLHTQAHSSRCCSKHSGTNTHSTTRQPPAKHRINAGTLLLGERRHRYGIMLSGIPAALQGHTLHQPPQLVTGLTTCSRHHCTKLTPVVQLGTTTTCYLVSQILKQLHCHTFQATLIKSGRNNPLYGWPGLFFGGLSWSHGTRHTHRP